MGKILLVLRTLRHVKPIQIWNRIWRKRLSLLGKVKAQGTGEQKCGSSLPTFTFLNTTAVPNGWNDEKLEKLWLYNLHYFDYLNNGSPFATLSQGQEIIGRWIDENPRGWGNGWEPYPISLRVVNWVKWLKREKIEGPVAQRIQDSLVQQVTYLIPRLEYHLLANHLLANAKALVFAGVYLNNERWLGKGLSIYKAQLPEQTCADGANFERSPMYHCIILEDILDCIWIMQRQTEFFTEYAVKMLAGLRLLTGPDGKIAMFNDSTEGIAKTPNELMRYAATLGIVQTEIRDNGKNK